MVQPYQTRAKTVNGYACQLYIKADVLDEPSWAFSLPEDADLFVLPDVGLLVVPSRARSALTLRDLTTSLPGIRGVDLHPLADTDRIDLDATLDDLITD